MDYIENNMEEYVNNMYKSIGIFHPHQLDMEEIAARLGISIMRLPNNPLRIDDLIILDSRKSDSQQWQDFGHELCHALWSLGNQISMPMTWEVYQESKSDNFAQYACIPTFMLKNMKPPRYENEAIWMIQETFGVNRDFAEKRLHQFLRNLYSR